VSVPHPSEAEGGAEITCRDGVADADDVEGDVVLEEGWGWVWVGREEEFGVSLVFLLPTPGEEVLLPTPGAGG